MSSPATVWSYRTLIVNLAQRELKSRYKKSFLGWAWSLINPATTLAIYSVVFGVFFGSEAPVAGNGRTTAFALYLFCGLVTWNFFSGTVNTSISSFTTSGPLLTRTYFPPECPVVAGMATVAIQACLELLILIGFLVAVANISWTVVFVLPVFLLLACFAFGIGLVLGLGNIRYRDVNYLVGIGMQVVFYLTPIVYSLDNPSVAEHTAVVKFLKLNPMTTFVNAMRRSLWELVPPTAVEWAVMSAWATVSLVGGWMIFSRFAPRVIEEL